MTPARRKVQTLFADNNTPRAVSDIAAQAGTSPAVVRGLISHGLLTKTVSALPQSKSVLDATQPGPRFSPDQEQAVDMLRQTVGAGYSCTVLEGVTGSGKTDVYFDTIATALQTQQQVLVLLPEIVLTEQWLQRFKNDLEPCRTNGIRALQTVKDG